MLGQFAESPHWPYMKVRANGAAQSVDLKLAVISVDMKGKDQIYLEIDAKTAVLVRPADFLKGVLNLDPTQMEQIVVTKLAV